MQCTEEEIFVPALNLPSQNCDGPYWSITINNEEYLITEQLYNKLKIGSSYSFTYDQFKGLSIIDE